MTEGGPYSRSLTASEHLQVLQSLATELERAMQAITSNNLQELEESVANQQDLSARLTRLAGDLCKPPSAKIAAVDSIPADLMQQIRAASAELQRLNLRYSWLLQYSSRSVALMASLFSSFQGQLKEVPGGRSKVQTWSCQG